MSLRTIQPPSPSRLSSQKDLSPQKSNQTIKISISSKKYVDPTADQTQAKVKRFLTPQKESVSTLPQLVYKPGSNQPAYRM